MSLYSVRVYAYVMLLCKGCIVVWLQSMCGCNMQQAEVSVDLFNVDVVGVLLVLMTVLFLSDSSEKRKNILLLGYLKDDVKRNKSFHFLSQSRNQTKKKWFLRTKKFLRIFSRWFSRW